MTIVIPDGSSSASSSSNQGNSLSPKPVSISSSLSLKRPLELRDGRKMTALEIQYELFERAQDWAQNFGLESVGESVGQDTLNTWQKLLDDLAKDPMICADRLDWVAKLRILEGFKERHGLDWYSPKLAGLSLQYHDMRPNRSLYRRAKLNTLVNENEVAAAVTDPPEDTRAFFRGQCLKRWAD